jgi:tetratricopeptide (TPR) repeat protein
MFAQRLTEHAEDLARHFARAEDWPRAVLYHREAGRKAAALCANTQAARWFQGALEILGRLPEDPETAKQAIEIRLELCRSMMQLGQLDEVLRLTRDAESLAQKLGDEQRLGEVYAYVSNYHYMKGEPDLAIRYGRLCLGLGEQSETSRTRRAARQYLGTSYHVLGEYGMAEEILAQQIASLETTEWFERLGPVNLSYVSSCAWLAFTLTELGEFRRAHEAAERAMAAASRAGHPYARTIAASFAGLVWHVQGEVDQALPLFETSVHLCAEHQLEVWRPVASSLLGHACAMRGKVERGLDLLWEAAALNERLGVQAYRALWTTYLAEALLVNGQTAQAIEAGQRALDLAAQNKEQGNHCRALQVLGTALIRQGPRGFDRANEHLRQALEQAELLRMRPLVAACYVSLATLTRQRGDVPTAARYLGTARSLASELGMRFWWERAAAE